MAYQSHESVEKALRRVIGKPSFWLIIALLVVITIPHYGDTLRHPALLAHIMTTLGLQRHSFERILYLVPIVWAGFLFGTRGAVLASVVALVAMLPYTLSMSAGALDAVFETSAVFIIGNVVAIGFGSLHKERERRARLTALNQVSSVVSGSLELSQILNSSIDKVMGVMRADAALVFLLDKEAGELILSAHKGITSELAHGMDRLKLGEGFNGRAAETGESLFVEDAAQDPRLTRMAVSEQGIHSEIIVPLKSKEKVSGTLCVAMYRYRWFQPEEVELLTAIGNQIGVAAENARLYQKEREIAEQLRTSEERYRELFENAHDAIWLHDLAGNIIAANRATVILTGYDLAELYELKATDLLSEEGLRIARSIERRLVEGKLGGSIAEIKLIRKDRAEVCVQFATSLLLSQGEPVAFQHIARDVTEQKQMQENLRLYLAQTTRAQEEERKRISHELHDETIQGLVVLSRGLDALISNGKGLSEDNRLHLEELRQQTNNITKGVRRLSQDLRPAALDRLGLLPALERLASEVAEYSGIEAKVNLVGTERRLPGEVELVLFRITQEALRNVWRHSQASKVETSVEFNERETRIIISDNGKGFNLPETIGDLARDGKLGLVGMQERARLIGGTLIVQSQPDRGTRITVELPA